MTAVLSCGPEAMLSHGSAAALLGDRAGVATDRGHGPYLLATPPPELRVRRRPTLADRHVTEREGVPVTGLVQTLVNLAAVHKRPAVERAVNEADRLDLIDPPTLRRELEVHRWEPGVRPSARDARPAHVQAHPRRSWNGASCPWPCRSACRCR